eukprot:scaffold190282_cov15-Tisochrysis_lutea.AAC.1
MRCTCMTLVHVEGPTAGSGPAPAVQCKKRHAKTKIGWPSGSERAHIGGTYCYVHVGTLFFIKLAAPFPGPLPVQVYTLV